MKKVFLSSTARDLVEYQKRGLRSYPADGQLGVRSYGGLWLSCDSVPETYCRDVLAKCEVVVFIVGHCYGSCPAGSKQSFTEHEYDAALKSRPSAACFPARTFLKPIRVASRQELKERILRSIAEINESTCRTPMKEF